MRNLIIERDQRAVQFLSILVSNQLAQSGEQSVETLEASLNRFVDQQPGNAVFVVNGMGEIVYQRGDLHGDGAALLRHEGVAEALSGEEGILFTDAPDGEHIVAYTRIAGTDWALLLEEPVQQVMSMTLNTTLIAPLTLLPLVAVMLFALWFGGQQIVRPLQLLARRADALGDGEYDEEAKSVGGISEVRQLESHLSTMARRINRTQLSLQTYAGAVTQAQEDERHRIARELHDGAIQTLTVMHQEVQLARWEENNGISNMLSTMDTQIANLTHEMRQIIHALRPGYLEELGLTSALEALTQEYSSAWEMPITFEIEGVELRLAADEELALYRIAQEVLNNIRKHAEASKAVVFLSFQPKRTLLTILDNGKGFDPPQSFTQTAAAGHFGLLGIYERAELVNAEVEIFSTAATGTQFSVSVSYSAE